MRERRREERAPSAALTLPDRVLELRSLLPRQRRFDDAADAVLVKLHRHRDDVLVRQRHETREPASRPSYDSFDHACRGRGQRVRCRGPKFGQTRVERGNLVRREMRGNRLTERRRFFPGDDRGTRRDTNDAEPDLDAGRVDGKPGERPDGGLERIWGGAENSRRRDVQLGDRASDQLALSPAGAYDRRAIVDRLQLSKQSKAILAAMFTLPRRGIGNHNHRRARGRGERARCDHARTEALNGRRLKDVERLSCCNTLFSVDEANLAHLVAPRQCMRERAAERSRTDNRYKRGFYRVLQSSTGFYKVRFCRTQ